MEHRTVLISGASIAGPALAFWLARYGFRPVIVERAAALRLGGQNIDIQGAAREVVRRMGIEGDIRAATTGEQGLRFVDEHDVTKAEIPAANADTGGFTQELEILRGDLARILYDRTRDTTEYIFGDQITGLRDHGDRVTVSFEKGAERDFDLVVAADGIRSRTRTLIVGDEPRIRQLGLYGSYFTIPRGGSDSAWARWYIAPGKRAIILRPDNVGTTRASLWFLSPPRGYERLSAAEQKALITRVFADAGWESPRVLAALAECEDVYFDSVSQVMAPRWSHGRAALAGDAAHCASPVSGVSASLALVGTYVLAGELSRRSSHRDAFAAYEKLMRPYVDQAQKLPPGVPWIMYPKSRLGISLLYKVIRVASSPLLRRRAGGSGSSPADKIELPDYSNRG
ncbi:FAD-dependent oxidoreductase [Sorangium cellulosum]|uniref:FAD-dependent oxidoreductase n=1 Tax=Sorangium cellulosum TaxID=56 RepID=A0A2L0EI20_SORCE|nr:FAD-dependent monooxygenase [Sorangium cellulosum]AUX38925.1 FAD-dependent oxidoreductase [Sorangium cellulosum]